MKCSTCSNEMELGYLAFYEPLVISRIVWQKEKPGYIRFNAPEDGIQVITPPILGKGDKQGYICKQCKNVFFKYE